uniref:Uncharacterized protein n=3 Tax=Rhodosorus marinus TaxID=101924 RepID=A0A7S3A602_9RHOD|mmetsp:Transcript_4734/g.20334  ORF Transcript_4734/g.20334 Transcript_4734/m.20334 type:complete len:256 (+) Transcript_4734:391-1158(+)|eukprot:CAMPEP_0113959642 /NCGR_PEP_ID=MMETSP0011_2-20120614/4260_1 /TAXON_ID=101924 /ORGANISM="Rhodosorus marinus" /LENGTH=255 /DNA_ID=CAMNT_0000970981 /DNA_START=346 /DNA_END=1113 /DNA_ORIENTATION=+ /assembly_acc=CAM_ASM_000156
MKELDPTYAFHLGLYALSLECILFFAVVSRSQDPYAHEGIARAFSLIFLFQSAAAFTCVLSLQSFKGVFSEVVATASAFFIIATLFVCIPGAALVAIPEMRYRVWKTALTLINIVALFFSAMIVGPKIGNTFDLPYVSDTLQSRLVGAVFGALMMVLIASLIRLVRPPESLKGRSGAVVLASGTIFILLAGAVWAYLADACQFTDSILNAACALPQSFDHNALLSLVTIIANGFVAEGVLRLMAAGTGQDGYIRI